LAIVDECVLCGFSHGGKEGFSLIHRRDLAMIIYQRIYVVDAVNLKTTEALGNYHPLTTCGEIVIKSTLFTREYLRRERSQPIDLSSIGGFTIRYRNNV
jgi:hypothetical protein